MTQGRRINSLWKGASRFREGQPHSPVDTRGNRGRVGTLLAGLALLLVGCGEDPDPSATAAAGGEALGGPIASSVERRDSRPDAVEARRLLGLGRADLARPLVEGLVDTLAVEGPLLMARLTFLEGDEGAWLALVEQARAQDPRDPRPYAAAAEIYATMDRRLAAKEEIERGLAAVGAKTPELQRSIGVLRIVTPGMGKAGLDTLEAARRADSRLPFMERPLGQAYFLSAKRALAESNGALALERVLTSLAFDPDDLDALEFHGRIVISQEGDHDKGLAILEDVYSRGKPIGPELGKAQWAAGLKAQVNGDLTKARMRYLRARELGSIEVGRGTALVFMEGQSDACFERAVERALAGDDAGAKVALAEGIGLRPDAASARRLFATRFAERAEIALGEERDSDAVSLLSAGLHMDRDAPAVAHVSASLYFDRAFSAAEKGDAEGALEFASQAARYAPQDSMMWLFLGDLQYATQDYASGADSLERAVALAQADEETVELATQLKFAECLHRTKRSEDAIQILGRAIAVAEAVASNGGPGQPLGRARAYLGQIRRESD